MTLAQLNVLFERHDARRASAQASQPRGTVTDLMQFRAMTKASKSQ